MAGYKTIMMKPHDKVAVALMDIPAGAQVEVQCQNQIFSIEIKEDIAFGHKFAVVSISSGADILKYGEVIGKATRDIACGQHVHIHNLEGKRGRGDLIHAES
ncbi:UxaA family hydrolase [Metabacillus sp. RGM 3146]|uniref:UxaA family hydrolase n=1 Tax=Metabacillus sp. RGM 3146 TaxID=3401092 RepID=UPI003B995D43